MKAKFKNITQKGLMSIVVVVVSVFLTIIISVANVILDPSKFDFNTWIGNTGISVGLSLIGMFCGEAIFGGMMMNDSEKKYQHALSEYNLARRDIDLITQYLQQYLDNQYYREVRSFKFDYLLANNVEQPDMILKLDIRDIDKLAVPYKTEIDGKVVYFKSYSKKKLEIIHEVLEGEIKLKRIGKNFYLNSDSKDSAKSDYLEAARLIQEKKFAVNMSRAIKIGSMVFVSAFLAMLTVQEVMNAGDTQAWVNLITRLLNIVLGLWSGYINASISVQEDVKALNLKTTKLKEFKRDFEEHKEKYETPDTQLEAKKEYEEFVKEQEEAVKNVVIPEPVDNLLLEHKGGGISGD